MVTVRAEERVHLGLTRSSPADSFQANPSSVADTNAETPDEVVSLCRLTPRGITSFHIYPAYVPRAARVLPAGPEAAVQLITARGQMPQDLLLSGLRGAECSARLINGGH